MQPVEINLPAHTRGDTWEGLTIGPVLFNGAQPGSALASCRLYFRSLKGKILIHKLKTTPGDGEGQITINNAVTWSITVPAQALPMPEGQFYWDFETTDAAGFIRTLYCGVLTITQEQSRD